MTLAMLSDVAPVLLLRGP